MQNDLAAFLKEQRRELTLKKDRAQLWRALWLLPGLRPTLEELDIPNPGPDEDRERREKHAGWKVRLAEFAKEERALTADEARAKAAAEGLELVPSLSNETGFKGVSVQGGGYQTNLRENGKQRYLGSFASAEEAALCYARHVGAGRAAAEAAEARGAVPQPLTADEARATAAAEGLELVPSASSESGFKGVTVQGGGYHAKLWVNGKQRYLGTFATAEEAALCYARHVGAERAQLKLSWKPPNGLQLMPQDSSAALGGGSPVAAATVVALMPAERANSFEWVTAHTPAPAHEPSPLPSLSPQAKKKPKSKFKWKPLKIAKASR